MKRKKAIKKPPIQKPTNYYQEWYDQQVAAETIKVQAKFDKMVEMFMLRNQQDEIRRTGKDYYADPALISKN